MASSSSSHLRKKERDAFSGIEPKGEWTKADESSRLFDVFINHRGPDVKQTLASQLYNSLNELGIHTFLDSEEKELGDSFPSTIEDVIGSAAVHIAILSKGYAESPWCLAELDLMLQSSAKIIPVFYGVKPFDLRFVERGEYAKAFTRYEEKGRYREKLREWKEALQSLSLVAGCEICSDYDISDCQNIVSAVQNEVQRKKSLHVAKYPVGLHRLVRDFERQCLDKLVEDFERQCRRNEGDKAKVQIVGIFGMGGVGKTALAKELFNRKRSQYSQACFLFDVREAYANKSFHSLQLKLLKDLYQQDHLNIHSTKEGALHIRNWIGRSNQLSFLLVVDDIDNLEQLDALMIWDVLNKSANTLVIVTTRDVGVLLHAGITTAYKMEGMDKYEAKELFCWNAFHRPYPCAGYEKLVDLFVEVCGGLPLSLQVLGSHVRGKDRRFWELGLEKVKTTLPWNIRKRLRISIDTLDDEEKQVFMDVACFFIGELTTDAINVWETSGWSGQHALGRLKNKCLVEESNECSPHFCDYSNEEMPVLRMHDHIRDLGREMADGLSHPRRLWRSQHLESLESTVFTKIITQPNVRCLISFMDRSLGSHIKCFVGESHDTLEPSTAVLWLKLEDWRHEVTNVAPWIPLQKLQFLRINDGSMERLWQDDEQAPLQLTELAISDCHKFESFPTTIGRLMHLKRISITRSKNVSFLPEDICLLKSLEHLQLRDTVMLESLPINFGDLGNMRYLDLSSCKSLKSLPDSFKYLSLLEYLNLQGCEQLTLKSEDFQNITRLEFLNLSWCEKSEELPRHITNQALLKQLYLRSMKMLRELPFNIGQLCRLRKMSIGSCLLTSFPNGLGNLSSLTNLVIEHCSELESLPDSFAHLSSLTHLSIEDCHNLKGLPDLLGHLSSLTNLSIQNCHNLEYCPRSLRDLSSLTNLKIFNCPKLLPDSFEQLTNLKELNLSGFRGRNLPWLPSQNLCVLELHGAIEMEELWEDKEHAPLQLRELIISGTWSASFERFPSSISYLSNLKKIALLGDIGQEFAIKELPEEFCHLHSLEHLELRHCILLSSLPAQFGDLKNLQHLDLCFCKELRMLPFSFQQLKLLNYLDLSGCERLLLQEDVLESIRQLENLCLSGCLALLKLPHHITDQACLRELKLQHTHLEDLPDNIGQLSRLEVLTIGSPLLQSLPDSLGNLSSLISLSITNCFALESLPNSLSHLVLLEYLCIEGTGVASLPEGFGQLAHLRTLKIYDCPLSDLDFGFVSSLMLEELTEIDLSETLVTRISIPKGCCPGLETLRLSKNDNLEVIETLPEKVKNIELSECETLKNIKGILALPISPNLTISDCPEIENPRNFHVKIH